MTDPMREDLSAAFAALAAFVEGREAAEERLDGVVAAAVNHAQQRRICAGIGVEELAVCRRHPGVRDKLASKIVAKISALLADVEADLARRAEAVEVVVGPCDRAERRAGDVTLGQLASDADKDAAEAALPSQLVWAVQAANMLRVHAACQRAAMRKLRDFASSSSSSSSSDDEEKNLAGAFKMSAEDADRLRCILAMTTVAK